METVSEQEKKLDEKSGINIWCRQTTDAGKPGKIRVSSKKYVGRGSSQASMYVYQADRQAWTGSKNIGCHEMKWGWG